MASKYKDKDGGVVLAFNGAWVSWSHTVIGYGMCSPRSPQPPKVSMRHVDILPMFWLSHVPPKLVSPPWPRTDNPSAAAFLGALLVGCSLHYRKIVKNAWFGYPDEWFPSVSAAIGDEYPERSVFQLLIAVTAGMIFDPPHPAVQCRPVPN